MLKIITHGIDLGYNTPSAWLRKDQSMAMAKSAVRWVASVATSVVGVGVLVATPAFASGASVANSTAIINLGTGTTAASDARVIHHSGAGIGEPGHVV